MSRDWLDDWADTVRDRDFRWGGPTCITDLNVTPLRQITILHVPAHDPRVKRDGEVPSTPPVRWAPERWCIAWKPEQRGLPRLLDYRVISFVSVN